jgi:hypothetical protein
VKETSELKTLLYLFFKQSIFRPRSCKFSFFRDFTSKFYLSSLLYETMASVRLTPQLGMKGSHLLRKIELEEGSEIMLGRNELTMSDDPPDNTMSRKHLSVVLRDSCIYVHAMCKDPSLIYINSTAMIDNSEKEVKLNDLITLLGSQDSFTYRVEASSAPQVVSTLTEMEEKTEISVTDPLVMMDETVVMDVQQPEEEEEQDDLSTEEVTIDDDDEDAENDDGDAENDDEDAENDGAIAVDFSLLESKEYATMPPALCLEHIMKSLCQQSKTPMASSVFQYSKLQQHFPLPFLAIKSDQTPLPHGQIAPKSAQKACRQNFLPLPLSTTELARISKTLLRGRRFADASLLTG